TGRCAVGSHRWGRAIPQIPGSKSKNHLASTSHRPTITACPADRMQRCTVLPRSSKGGHLMAYLRFSPAEYKAISCLCRPLDLNNCRHSFLKQTLVLLLTDTLPALAERIANYGPGETKILLDHLREGPNAETPHGLTAEEMTLVVEAGGPLLPHA